jgi:hypothetical protein
MVIAAVLTAGLLLVHVSDFLAKDASSRHLSSFLFNFDGGARKSGDGAAPAIRACRDDEEGDLRDWAVQAANGSAAAGDLVMLRMPEVGPVHHCSPRQASRQFDFRASFLELNGNRNP